DVTVTNRRQSNHRPINTRRNARKTRFRMLSFHHKHNRTNHHDNQNHKRKKNHDFSTTLTKRNQQYASATHKLRQTENPENPKQSQNPYARQVFRRWIDDAHISRQNAQQINDSIKTEKIPPRLSYTI